MYTFKLIPVSIKFDYRKVLKDSGHQQCDIDDVRLELRQFKQVPTFIMNEQILAFLMSCSGNIEDTVKKVCNYYKCKNDIPEFFKDRDLESTEIQQCFDNQHYVTLPVTPSGCNLIFFSLSNYEPKNYIFDSACKMFIMLVESYLFERRDGPRPDTIFLFDMAGAKFRHALQPSISSIRRGMYFLENASPLNFQAVHVLNAPSFMGYIFSLVRPFTTTGIISKVHLHHSDIDWEDFYKNEIPRSHLPSDYGGDLKSVKELHEEKRERIFDLKDYFEFEELQVNHKFDELLGDHAKDIIWEN